MTRRAILIIAFIFDAACWLTLGFFLTFSFRSNFVSKVVGSLSIKTVNRLKDKASTQSPSLRLVPQAQPLALAPLQAGPPHRRLARD